MVRTRDKDGQMPYRLQVWDTLELDIGDGCESSRYQAQVKTLDDDQITLERPVRITGTLPLQKERAVTATFVRDDAVYSFDSRITGHPSGGVIVIESPTAVERIQRRGFFRVPVDFPVSIWLPEQTGESGDIAISDEIEVRCVNISGNGMLIQCKDPVPCRHYAMIRFEVDRDCAQIATLGRVLRLINRSDHELCGGLEFYTAREAESRIPDDLLAQLPVEFRNFSERDRETLINQLLSRQVAMRQRGML